MAHAQDDATPHTGLLRGQGFLLLLAAVLIVAGLFVAWPYRSAILLAVFLGYLLQPVQRWLVGRVKRPWLAGGVVVLLVAAVLVLPLVIMYTVLLQEVQRLAVVVRDQTSVEALVAQALSVVGAPQGLASGLVDRATDQLASVAQAILVTIFTALPTLLIALIVFFILLYFVVTDWDALVDYARRVTPLDHERRDQLFARTGERVHAIFLGTIAVALVQGVVSGLGWWFFGFPAPVFWAFVMTVLEVIPIAGAFLVMIPAALWALAQGDIFAGVGLLVYTLVVVGVIDDVVRPYFIGERSGVHPGIILVGIVGGIEAFGVVGFILGPLLLSLVGPVVEAWARPGDAALERPEEDGDDGGDGRGAAGEDDRGNDGGGAGGSESAEG